MKFAGNSQQSGIAPGQRLKGAFKKPVWNIHKQTFATENVSFSVSEIKLHAWNKFRLTSGKR
jgi:hypothetical protein